MAVTLSTALWNALESKRHHPIARVTSSQMTSEFPMEGTQLYGERISEIQPQIIYHSSGRMMAFWHGSGYGLKMAYTDVDRTFWTIVDDDSIGSTQAVGEFAVVELANGNIGVVWALDYSGYNSGYRGMWGTSVVTELGIYVPGTFRYVVSTTQSSPFLYPSICRTSTGYFMVSEGIVNPGGGYYLYGWTSTDPDSTFMESWTTTGAITLTGLDLTVPKGYPTVTRSAGGQIVLMFDYRHDYQDAQYQQDLWYCVSTDNGATFSAPAKFTSSNSYSSGYEAPNAAFDTSGNLIVAFHERASVVNLRASTTGWNVGSYAGTEAASVRDIHYDSASGLLFAVIGREEMGSKGVYGAVVIDPETFTVVKCYNAFDSSPKFSSVFEGSALYGDMVGPSGDGQYMVFGGGGSDGICLINHQTETITEYWYDGASKNIDVTPDDYGPIGFKVDVSSGKLYVMFMDNYFWHPRVIYGYIDITQSADPITGMYEWNELNRWNLPHQSYAHWFRAFPNEGYSLLATQDGSGGGTNLYLIQLDTGVVIEHYTYSTNAGFPWGQIYGAVIKDNKIYIGIGYTTDNDQGERRGMCIVDIPSHTVTYERPTYATYDDYYLYSPILIEGDTKILWASWGGSGGAVEYDIANHTWRRFDGETNPGLSAAVMHVAYDDTNNVVFQGNYGNQGVYIYTPSGNFYTTKYMSGTPSGGSYTWGGISQLSTSYPNQIPAIGYDSNGIMYAMWLNENIDTGYNYLNWAKTGMTQDVASNLVKDSPLTIEWEVDRPARVRFTLANGHLYDPTNTMSLLSGMFKKHRLITVDLGERSNSVDYYSQQGQFIVTSTELRLDKKSHPTITITGEDRSTMWDEIIVSATQNYGGSSVQTIMSDLLEDVANMQPAEYSIPTVPNQHTLYIQWVDESLYDIVDQICNHFGVFPYWNHSGIFTFKEFNLSAAVSHKYWNLPSNLHITLPAQTQSDWSKITEWSPQDSGMSYVNRVTVKAESHTTHEVVYPEERVTEMSGTCGWWGGKRDKIIWYSDDQTRTMRYPRLNIITSVSDTTPYAELIGSSGGESITDIDSDEHWCEVTIEQPDMSMWVFGLAAIIAGFGIAATIIPCDGELLKPGWCFLFILLTNLALSQLITVLSGVASYDYEIWARPIGKVKQTVQATANDEEFQRDMNGQVVEHTFEDSLSYNVEHCQNVANHEIAVVHAQRNRVALTKICHLRDELGDVIQLPHPINAQFIKIFIAKLTRVFMYGDEGEFTDKIEGWLV